MDIDNTDTNDMAPDMTDVMPVDMPHMDAVMETAVEAPAAITAGPDLRADSAPDAIYYQLKDARSAARSVERNNVGLSDDDQTQNPHWKKIFELAPQALAQSQDLEIAAWYAEALLREQGFAGLAQGFNLMHDMIANVEGIYPAADEDGIETTLAPLTGLNGTNSPGTLIQPMNCVAVTDSVKGEKFATWQYLQSADLSRAPNDKARQERIKNGVLKMEVLVAAANSTPKAFYENLQSELSTASKAYDALVTLTMDKYGHDAPPSSHIKKAFRNARAAIKKIAKDILADPMAEVAEVIENGSDIAMPLAPTADGVAVAGAPNLNTTSTIQNRAAAFETLKALAEFFKRTEPHSPVGFALDRAIRWGDKELPDLLKELIEDPSAQDMYRKLTGIEKPEPPAMPMAPAPGAAPGMGHDPYAAPPPGGMNNGMGNDPFAAPPPPPPNYGGGF